MTVTNYRLSADNITIPARIFIGVTGHRRLDDKTLVAAQIQQVLAMIKDMVSPLKNTPIVFTLVSSLAEGADSLVAREVLKIPNSQLEALLPLDKEEYLSDFESDEAKQEFIELLACASHIKKIPCAGSRHDAYAQAGRHMVNYSEALIAIWNGEDSKNNFGTAATVQYAGEKGCPIFWIHSANPERITFQQEKVSIVLKGTADDAKRTWKKYLKQRAKEGYKQDLKLTPF